MFIQICAITADLKRDNCWWLQLTADSGVFYFGTFGSDTTSLSVFCAHVCTSSNSLQAQPVCVVTRVLAALHPGVLARSLARSCRQDYIFLSTVFSLRDPCTGVIHPSRGSPSQWLLRCLRAMLACSFDTVADKCKLWYQILWYFPPTQNYGNI